MPGTPIPYLWVCSYRHSCSKAVSSQRVVYIAEMLVGSLGWKDWVETIIFEIYGNDDGIWSYSGIMGIDVIWCSWDGRIDINFWIL